VSLFRGAAGQPARRWVRVLGTALGFLLAALLVDLGALAARLRGLPPELVVWGLWAGAVQVVLSATRWRFTAERLGLSLPLPAAVREYWLATFLNQVLPGGVVGDVGRAIRHGARAGGDGDWGPAARAARAVLYERTSGQLAMGLLALAGAATLFADEAAPAVRISPRGVAFGALLVASVAAAGAAWRLPGGAPSAPTTGAPKPVRSPAGLPQELRAIFLSGAAPAIQLGLSLLLAGTLVAMFGLAAEATGSPLPPMGTLAVAPLVLFSMVLPVSVAGWGGREAVAAWVFGQLGAAPEAGVATSAVYGVLALIGALPGVLFLPAAPPSQRAPRSEDDDRSKSNRTSSPSR